jgi:hypothetical protein
MGGSTGVLNDRKRWAYGFPRLQRFDLVNIGPSTDETGFHAARTVQYPGCRAPAPERTCGEPPLSVTPWPRNDEDPNGTSGHPPGNDEDPDASGNSGHPPGNDEDPDASGNSGHPPGNDEDPDANGIRVFVYRVTATA